ncbi:MAG: 2-amino-4-hydroxy-6-hydroxymethyldihydropteridine diphosphokinase [Rhodoferax sp.]
MRPGVTAFIALGANLGDPAAALLGAIDAIAALPGVSLRRRSSLYRSAPIDSSGPDYLNAVLEVESALSAPDLLAALQAVEHRAGRQRSTRNAPRTLDLDILLYGDARIDSATLVVPHPRLSERAFVLLPLSEIAPNQVSAAQLQAVQQQAIERISGPFAK